MPNPALAVSNPELTMSKQVDLPMQVPYVSVESLQGCIPAPSRVPDMLFRVQNTSCVLVDENQSALGRLS